MQTTPPGTEYRTSRGERFSYWMYFFGENIFYGLIAINMQAFYSDMGITAASIAAILFVTKIWDAINDPLFGVLIDRIKFKHGRFLPWLRLALPLLAISSILFFALPGHANPALKIVWACAAYIAWDASYTLCDVPIFILPTSMTDNIKERSKLLAMGRYFAMIGITGTAMLLPILQKRLGWLACGIIFSVLAVITMLPLCFKAKERRVVRSEKEISLKQMAHYVISNKYLLLFYCAMFVSGLTNFIQYVTLFFARHNLGNQDAAALLSLMSMIPTLLIGALIPIITRYLDKFNLYIFCQVAASIFGIVRYFAGYENLRLFYCTFLSPQHFHQRQQHSAVHVHARLFGIWHLSHWREGRRSSRLRANLFLQTCRQSKRPPCHADSCGLRLCSRWSGGAAFLCAAWHLAMLYPDSFCWHCAGAGVAVVV